MVAGVQTVKSGEMSQRAAQTTFSVPRAILQTHLNEKVTLGANPGKMSRFTYQQERKRVMYVCNLTDMGVRLSQTTKQFLIYAAGSYAKRSIL